MILCTHCLSGNLPYVRQPYVISELAMQINMLVSLGFLILICPRIPAGAQDQISFSSPKPIAGLSSSKRADSFSSSGLAGNLAAAGFENVRVSKSANFLTVSIEDPVFRWNIEGIRTALDTLARHAGPDDQIILYLLEYDIPRLIIKLSANTLDVTYAENRFPKNLSAVSPLNPSVNKIDLIGYPQFALQNTLTSRIYEIQLNLAPAIEVSLWKGMQFTGQVIFPIKNDLGYEGDFIRPGFVTLAQEFRVRRRWFGRFVLGNFNANRYGSDFTLSHPLRNSRWEAAFNAGLTGSSYFYHQQWRTSAIDRLTWFVRAGHYYPRYNLQFDLSYGRYINRDDGFRADCTRHFGAASIGFYAIHTGGDFNGGFHFAAPLPPRKRSRKHMLRIIPPRYFDWEYNAGTEFYYGRYYETRPDENRSERYINPGFIKNELLKSLQK